MDFTGLLTELINVLAMVKWQFLPMCVPMSDEWSMIMVHV